MLCQKRFLVVSHWLVWFAVLVGVMFVHAQQQDVVSVAESLKRLRAGEVYPADTHRLAEAGTLEAIPPLKEQFAVQKETFLKAAIASALVRLGEKESVYWDFLVEQATTVVESDAPSVFSLDSSGKVIPGRGQLPPEFTAWAKANNLDPATAAQSQVYELPAYVTFLGITGDRRGREILQKGLLSRNYMVQVNAAKGLAKLRDHDSIPLIIQACEKMIPELAPVIARTLLFFDDPRGQRTAEKFIPDKQQLERLRKQAREKGADPYMFF